MTVQELFEIVAPRYGGSEGSDRFRSVFFSSLKRVLIDLGTRVGISEAAPTSFEAELSLSDDYLNTLIDGLVYYIGYSGEWGQADQSDTRAAYELALRRSHTVYFNSQSLKVRLYDEDEADDDDDE